MQTKLCLYRPAYPFCCTVRKHGHCCRKIYGSLKPSTRARPLPAFLLGYAGTTLLKILRFSVLPTFPAFTTSSQEAEITNHVVRHDDRTFHCALSQAATAHVYWFFLRPRLAPALAQVVRATCGYSRSPMVHPSAFVLNGPRTARRCGHRVLTQRTTAAFYTTSI